MTATHLSQYDDPVRQRAPAPGARARAGPGRRAGPAPPAARRPGAVPDRHRRQLAQERAGRRRPRASPCASSCGRNAAAFAALRGPLALSFDDFIRTSSDPRHRPGVERLWRACADARRPVPQALRGPVLRRLRAVLPRGRADRRAAARSTAPRRSWWRRRTGSSGCPGTPSQLHDLISSGRLRIEPAARRNEVLGFIAGGPRGLQRLPLHGRGPAAGASRCPATPARSSTSGGTRSATTSPRSATAPAAADYQRWWPAADRRVHLVGKGVLRFHAVYWPAMLLSAGRAAAHRHPRARLPDRSDGRKISKSGGGTAADPVGAGRRGTAPTRCAGGCCARCPGSATPTSPPDRLIARANEDLANGLGNLVNRVVTWCTATGGGWCPAGVERPGGPRRAGRRRGAGRRPAPGGSWPRASGRPSASRRRCPLRLPRRRRRRLAIVDEANRYIERAGPGSWPRRSAAIPRPPPGWTPPWPSSSAPADAWPTSSPPSSPPPLPGSPRNAPRLTRRACCPAPSRSSPGSPRGESRLTEPASLPRFPAPCRP